MDTSGVNAIPVLAVGVLDTLAAELQTVEPAILGLVVEVMHHQYRDHLASCPRCRLISRGYHRAVLAASECQVSVTVPDVLTLHCGDALRIDARLACVEAEISRRVSE